MGLGCGGKESMPEKPARHDEPYAADCRRGELRPEGKSLVISPTFPQVVGRPPTGQGPEPEAEEDLSKTIP